jgi:hypothetical protein
MSFYFDLGRIGNHASLSREGPEIRDLRLLTGKEYWLRQNSRPTIRQILEAILRTLELEEWSIKRNSMRKIVFTNKSPSHHKHR